MVDYKLIWSNGSTEGTLTLMLTLMFIMMFIDADNDAYIIRVQSS